MGVAGGPDIERNGLVFGYDTGYGVADNSTATRLYPGETTENLIYDMGGTVTSAYPEVVYRSTATETNVVEASAPGGKYSRFTGIDDSSNNQLYSRFSSYSIDVRGDSVNYSVYLKGSGTCHLTIYDNQSGYGTSSTITLTSDWVRYNYTRTVNASATSYWVAVRGVLSTTDVYVAGQQATRGTHSTPYVENNRSSTQSLIDLTKTTDIDVSNVSFDSTGQPTFDGTDDRIDITSNLGTLGAYTFEYVAQSNSSGNMPVSSRTSTAFYKYGAYSWRYTHGGVASEFYHTYGADTGWAHWVITYDGSTITVYENNISKGTRASTGTADFTGGIRIGSWASSTSYTWDGQIPVLKVYDRALSSDEVQQNYNAYKNRFNL